AVEADPVSSADAGGGQALAVEGAVLGQAGEQVVQAAGLEAGPFVGRHPLGPRVPHGVHRSTSPCAVPPPSDPIPGGLHPTLAAPAGCRGPPRPPTARQRRWAGPPLPKRPRAQEGDVGVFDRMAEHGHEQVVFCFDRQTGMRAIIAIHDTALGPARGGTRYKAYASEEEALEDALRLSKGMTYKFAFTDLPRGGGKAVLLKQDGAADKRVLLRSFGRFVQLLAGRFGTGPDLGTSAQEMVEIARETDYGGGSDPRCGGPRGAPPATAGGVFAGSGAALDEVYGTSDVAGRRIAIQGLGGVGGHLA